MTYVSNLIVLCFFISILRVLLATEAPIIGVLSQEADIVNKFVDRRYKSYIAASYVKFLESAGARVVPILIGRDRKYYEELIGHVNGVLFPGGAVPFNVSGGYAEAGQIIYDLSIDLNNKGQYFPIWATCLGLELIPYVALKGKEFRMACSASKIALPLHFKNDFLNSKLFSQVPEEIIHILTTRNITYNNHEYCYTEKSFRENNLLDEWSIISTNKDVNGIEFISVFESKKYPIYAIQFHPEKNNFEFKIGNNVPHGLEAAKISQYLANFFVEEARRNDHRYSDWNSEMMALIYNHSPQFTGAKNSSFLQMYMFEEEGNEIL